MVIGYTSLLGQKLNLVYKGLDKMSAANTGLGGGAQRINNSPLDCLEHNDRILFIGLAISLEERIAIAAVVEPFNAHIIFFTKLKPLQIGFVKQDRTLKQITNGNFRNITRVSSLQHPSLQSS